MKLILIILMSFCVLSLFAQTEVASITNRSTGIDIKINFAQQLFSRKTIGDKTIIKFENALDEASPGTPILPSKTFFIAIPPESKIKISIADQKYNFINDVEIDLNPEVKLSNDSMMVYKDSKPDLAKFVSDQIPSAEVELIDYTWLRDYYCAVVRVNTHTYNWKKKEIRELQNCELNITFNQVKTFQNKITPLGEFDKILDRVIVNYNSAGLFRSYRPNSPVADSSGNWIDYSQEYVKLQIPIDGIYRIDYNQVLSFGINPASVNPKTFKIYSKGHEVPIYVSGESDLSFDVGDYIEFWAERNYGAPDYREIVSLGEDYLNYFNRYSDTSIVWLTWDGNEGKRTFVQNTTITGLTDTSFIHKAFYHLEEDVRFWYYDAVLPRVQLPFWQENKVWTWHFLGSGGQIQLNFDANNFVPNTDVNVILRMISNGTRGPYFNCHRFGLSLNSSNPQDTIVFNFKETVNFSGDFNSNQLLSGNNIVTLFGMQNDSLIDHQALIDWVDVEYQRFNLAVNDSVWIRIPENVNSSVKVVKVTNINQPSGNILVYKIKPIIKKIESFSITNTILTFSDTVKANDEYFIINSGTTNEPVFKSKKYFINLRDNSRGADYIAISNKLLQASAQAYIDFVNDNYQTRNELIFDEDIYDEFSYGYKEAEAIRKFLNYTYLNWVSPSPSYLLLLGDANYDYKDKISPPPNVRRINLIPSFGNPVSDAWYSMWDSSNVNVPQMFVGRIPVTSDEQAYFYLDKHQDYLNRSYDDFNKRYLLFSGGDPDNPSELELLRSVNNQVLNNLIRPVPIGGEGIHFYKTVDPLSNFGPYTGEQIDNAIDSSGLFISYIGHSGTESWDNGITDVTDIQPKFGDRLSLITDFGCSTGKFAEPDVDAFGEIFISASPDGQAIAYLGNASWGYVSTSINFPQLFYELLLLDSTQVISEVHYLAKMKLLNLFGTSDVNRVFNFCNTLFGDPLISLKLPSKPNFLVDNSYISLVDPFPTDVDDSVGVKIQVINFGRTFSDSLSINVTDNYLGDVKYAKEFKIPVPLFKKNITVNIPIENLVGEHNLEITIDGNDEFDEIYEDDNSTIFSFIVYSSSVRPIEAERFYNSSKNSIEFLNPTVLLHDNVSELQISIDDNPDFVSSTDEVVTMDTIITLYQLPSLQNEKRYWLRSRLNQTQSDWSEPFSFYNEITGFDWYFNHSFNLSDIEFENVKFDSTNFNWKLNRQENLLEIESAGGIDGKYGSIKLNNLELLPNSFYWGIATAIIDSITLQPSDFNYFIYHEPMIADSQLIAYIDSLPLNTLLAMTISDDGAQSVLGWSSGTPVRQAIETLGSLYIDSVFYRDSWCMIGKKGAPQGSVPESFSKSSLGPAFIDTSLIVSFTNGWIEFPAIKNSSKWLSVTKTDSIPFGSEISYIPLGIKSDHSIDTLSTLQFLNDFAALTQIDANIYPSIKLIGNFEANENYESPVFKKLGVNFLPVPDLAINFQVVSTSADSVLIGEDISLSFKFTNVVETTADSFNVKVEILNKDNSRQTIFSQKVDSLQYSEFKSFDIFHKTSSGSGSKTFLISIDSENEIRELFEDNNFFSIPFYVEPDTTTPTITLTFDGNDILDGDFISPEPEIHIELFDESLLQINDPSSVLVYLNDNLVPSDTSIINYTFSTENPKVTVDYSPSFPDGDYTLKVLWKDVEGNIVDSSGVEKYFQVSSEAQLLYVYNYPNPTSGETYFTFKLTQIPNNIQIKIYTIAGRLIKNIDLNSSELKFDFNKIYWDGKDEDGDPIANGVYLYKVIMQAGDVSQAITQKLAIVK